VGDPTNIFEAINKLSSASVRLSLKRAWLDKYPGKEKHWDKFIEPYIDPPFMLYSAPVNRPLLSLIALIAEQNNIEVELVDPGEEVVRCQHCGLLVTYRDKGLCLKCYANWLSGDLDEI